jgi:hypothetical protein
VLRARVQNVDLTALIGRHDPGWSLERPFYTSEIYALDVGFCWRCKWYVLS